MQLWFGLDELHSWHISANDIHRRNKIYSKEKSLHKVLNKLVKKGQKGTHIPM